MTEIAAEAEVQISRLSRVSVICGGAQVDVSLPLQTPTEVLIPELVRLLGDRIAGTAESAWARPWRLAPIGGEPLRGPQAPADAGVTDGDLLVLFVAAAPPPPPVFDDIFETTAADLNSGGRWDERTAAHVGIAVLALATAATAAVSLRFGLAPRSAAGGSAVSPLFALLWTGIGALALLLGAGLAVRRMRAPGAVPTALATCSTVLAGVAAALAVPLGGGGHYGAPNALLAAVAVGAVSLVAIRVTGRGVLVHGAAFTASALAVPALFALIWLPDRRAAIAATVAVLAYVVVVFAARIGAVLAGLPLPKIPAAGERIDPIDDEPPATIAGVGAVATGLADDAGAPPRAAYAQTICSAAVVGAVAAGTFATLVVGAASRELPAQNLAFVVVIAIAYCLRGRTHSDPIQAGSAILGGAIIAVCAATSLAWGFGPWALAGLIALAGLVGLAFCCGVVAPRTHFSPVQRRLAELGEYLTIAAAGPLLGWIWDVYATVRNL